MFLFHVKLFEKRRALNFNFLLTISKQKIGIGKCPFV